MKKIYNAILLVLALGLASCAGEVEDIFDKSSAQRVNEALQADMDILTSAENGWLLEMYGDPSNEMGFGGYNTYLKFNKDNTVTVGSELAADLLKTAGDVVTSHFKLYNSQGINLSFDEYNDLIHVFSDPINKFGIGEAGKGLKGDLEYSILSISKEKVVLKGKKSGIKLEMVPVKAGVNWTDDINNTLAVEGEMTGYSKYNIAVGEQTFLINRTGSRMFSYKDENGNITNIPFIVKSDGIKFKEELLLGGVKINGFKYNETGDEYVSTDNETIKLIPIIPPLAETVSEGDWFMSMDNSSELMASVLASVAEGSAVEGETIAYLYLSNNGDGTISLVFRSGNYVGQLIYEYAIDEENNTITYRLSKLDGNGSYYYNNYEGYQMLAAALNGTFSLEADDIKSPSIVKFTSTSNPDINFIATADVIYYPMGK